MTNALMNLQSYRFLSPNPNIYKKTTFSMKKFRYIRYLFKTNIMNVSTKAPFQIIYSLFEHEYLGDLFESFVVQKNDLGKLTFKHQNISAMNAKEFASGLDEKDFQVIALMDTIQQDVVYKKFNTKKLTPTEFYLKVFDKEKGDKVLQEAIRSYVDSTMTKILPLLINKEVFIMGNDGEPAWKQVEVSKEPATVLFHFMRNENNTHYFPTIKHRGEKIDYQYNSSLIVCNDPAWLLVGEEKIVHFDRPIEGKKIKPFLRKKFIEVPKKIEDTYYNNFVTNIIASYDVHAKGFQINDEVYVPTPVLTFAELASSGAGDLLKTKGKESNDQKIIFTLSFRYGENIFELGNKYTLNSVTMEKTEDSFLFHKIHRDIEKEISVFNYLRDELGLEMRNGKKTLTMASAFSWLNEHREALLERDFHLSQQAVDKRKYFIGKTRINIEVRENNDWFDIYAIVSFGDYEIPFIQLKDIILSKKKEFVLPNGEIAVIPEEWIEQYGELIAFSDTDNEGTTLKKHHLALVQELDGNNLAKVSINKKLEKLQNFDHIEDSPMPNGFKGELRPYQKAGYNWMKFLNTYNFGGCLADDMGLGKTVQTLALLQDQKEQNDGATIPTLLILPTSLVYNWQAEASKFCPDLKTFVYTGTYREKNVEQFKNYDIIITTYGIARLDATLLSSFYFHYIILDESQNIKNPNSNIFAAVQQLKSSHKLILTGTPVENSTMDLWSQMSFINDGLLGGQRFFRNNFLNPIEKKNDSEKKEKLHTIIKPFILRRKKEQVLTELPPKIEQVWYCDMTDEQQNKYEEVKSFYRNMILDEIDASGMGKTQMMLLQGLTQLRQIANHPRMVAPEWEGESGKMKAAMNMMENAIEKNHKLLIFSQFVKHLTLFREVLDEKEIKYAYLDGTTKDRQGEVDKFQKDKKLQVFLISLKAGGLGLNLTAADYVFILDPWWNPAIEAQAVDRAYRMGQKNTVHTYKFITKNSVEEKILKLQNSKKQLAEDLIAVEESFMKSLSREDIADILM